MNKHEQQQHGGANASMASPPGYEGIRLDDGLSGGIGRGERGDLEENGGGKLNLVRQAVHQAREQDWFARVCDDPLAHAFNRKTVVHAGMSGKPVDKDRVAAVMNEMFDAPRTGKSTAYVHIPFCETHCLYCGFYTTAYRNEHSAPYTDALLGELRAEQDREAVRGAPIHALYLGGGTPTALAAADLKRLLLGLREYLPLANDCEITVEGRVHGLSREKMAACLEGGANRFSLGVQTFNTDIRRSMGRIGRRQDVIETLRTLQEFDAASIVIDLIFGLPGQSMENWQEDLRTFDELELDGCDLYQLNIFPGGKLDKALKSGQAAPAADLAGQSRMFKLGVEYMTGRHMRRLSMSHWGRTPRERNLYNPLMKSRANCLAYGAGGGGNLHGCFYFIQGNFEKYMAARKDGIKPVVMVMGVPDNLDMIRSLTSQMEQGWLDLARVTRDSGVDAHELFAPLLSQWEEAGLLQCQNGQVELTLAGQFWQMTMTQALIDWHQHKTRGS
ncbi:MAG: heme anaerobic degradation radical SAM methyltransferase ChuW/HutW [Desulfovibrio sp.]